MILLLVFNILAADALVDVSNGNGYKVRNVTAVMGRKTVLQCNISQAQGSNVAWIKHDTRTIISLHGELVTQSNRYGISNKKGDTLDLIIKEIKPEDNGFYICQMNTNPMINTIFNLQVVQPPSIVNSDKENVISAHEGGSIDLTCQASGIPMPTVYWVKNESNNVIGMGEVLHLSNISLHHAGTYYCIANNSYAPIVSKTFHLSVQYSPRIIYLGLGKDGDGVICQIKSNPLPSAAYIEKRKFSRTSLGIDFIQLSSNLPENDFTFNCSAENSVGAMLKSYRYRYQGKPKAQFHTPAWQEPNVPTTSSRHSSKESEASEKTWNSFVPSLTSAASAASAVGASVLSSVPAGACLMLPIMSLVVQSRFIQQIDN